jgi:hypothetical protein
MLSVKCIEENTVFDITLEKVAFADTLKQNLAYFEKHEMFEECVKINEAIAVLSKSK